jgi:hypothetical protein
VLPIIILTRVAAFSEVLDKPLYDPFTAVTRPNEMLVAEQLVSEEGRKHVRATEGIALLSALVSRIAKKRRASLDTKLGDGVSEHLTQ